MTAPFARKVPPAAASPDIPDTADALVSLQAWLLGPDVQIASGVHAGAAAGWIDSKGDAMYVYPEITGYYLQWLAWHAVRHGASDDVRGRAAAAQRWLCSWARAEAPLTRVYLRPSERDWRNAALFFFDLAMVMRGVAGAARAGLIEADPELVDRISALLLRLVADDGIFDACRRTDAKVDLPDRWSTRRGAFLAKAASGVLSAAAQFPAMPNVLRLAAEATFRASLESMAKSPHSDTHALLYGIEGALSQPDHPAVAHARATIAGQLRDVVRRCDAAGHIPESRGGGLARLDIVAQTLRAATLEGTSVAARSDIAPLAQVLVRSIDPKLGIPFSPSERPGQYNAWTAMFAEQALVAAGCSTAERPAADLCLYIV